MWKRILRFFGCRSVELVWVFTVTVSARNVYQRNTFITHNRTIWFSKAKISDDSDSECTLPFPALYIYVRIMSCAL